MGLGRHLTQEPSQSSPAKMQSARRWGTESGLQAAASTTALERRRVSFHCPMSSAFGSACQVYGTLDATLFIPHEVPDRPLQSTQEDPSLGENHIEVVTHPQKKHLWCEPADGICFRIVEGRMGPRVLRGKIFLAERLEGCGHRSRT